MLASNIPTKMPVVWASSAPGADVHQVPTQSQIGITNGAASFTDGFPPLNFLPVASGGVPPFGNDFNGILQQMTGWDQWQQLGGPVPFDGTFASAIAGLGTPGYPRGASIAATLATGNVVPGAKWISLSDGNTTNPDLNGSLGGSGWSLDFALNGTVVVNVSGNTDVTLTPAQYGYKNIWCNGTLTGNINLIFPANGGPWTVYNNSSGAFTITGKVAGGGGVLLGKATLTPGPASTTIWSDGANVRNSVTYIGTDLTLGAGLVLTTGNVTLANNAGMGDGIVYPYTFSVGHQARITGANAGGYSLIVDCTGTGGPGQEVLQISIVNAAPNNSTGWFWHCDDQSAERAAMLSNGGLANFSANNVNLSDVSAKTNITAYTADQLEALGRAFCAVDWGTYKYKDQTHDDPNHGYTAQGVKQAFDEIAPELTDKWIDGKQLAVYETDLGNIGMALIAQLWRERNAAIRK